MVRVECYSGGPVLELVAQFGKGTARRRVSLIAMMLVALGAMVCAPLARANNAQAGAVAQTASPAAAQNHAGPGLDVAIADFDGDMRPDSARVQHGRAASGGESYAIDFRLSSTGAPAQMNVVAPRGGLRIEARDVNGDNAIDLVLTTAWFREPVAILLNDGHGKFSTAAPTAYPNAFNRPASTLTASYADEYIAFAMATQSDFILATAQTGQYQPAPAARGVVAPSTGFRAGPALAGFSGRAPPASLHLSA